MIAMLCALLCLVSSARGQGLTPCTEADIGYTLTECDDAQVSRQAVEFWNRACLDTGTVTLRPPMAAPCELECTSGTFYSARFIGCERCPDGYSSTREITINNFVSWPSLLTTFCNPQPCQPWQVSPTGSFLWSGNQTAAGTRRSPLTDMEDEAVVSVLKFQTRIMIEGGGLVRIVYRVESEELFDGLAVYINNERQSVGLSPYLATGIQSLWRDHTFYLPQGMVEVRFEYQKDSGKSTYRTSRVGTDMAYIHEISLKGTMNFATDCAPCPAGMKGTLTRSSCVTCPDNTFSAVGSMTCTPCPDGYYSTAGSAACIQRVKCASTDYTARFSRCNIATGTRGITYALTNPYCQITSSSLTATLPTSMLCSACLSGMYISKGVCTSCSEGQYFTSSCLPCGPGTAAIPSFTLKDFDALDGDLVKYGFSAVCSGDCFGKKVTWFTTSRKEKSTSVVVMSSGDLGNQGVTTLYLKVNLASPGYVAFKYYFNARFATASMMQQIGAHFYLNDTRFDLDTTKLAISDLGVFTTAWLPAGPYQLEWSVRKDFVPEQVYLEIRSLEVIGDTRGGATKCYDCQKGYTCPGGTSAMIPCPLGTYSDTTRSTSCTACPSGTVASNIASTSCVACPASTIASFNNSRCTSTCLFTNGSNVYDMRPLGFQAMGPIFRAGQPEIPIAASDALNIERLFLNLCDYVPPSAGSCSGNGGFACTRFSANRSFNLGTSLSVRTAGYSGIILQYTNGDVCGLIGERRSTQVNLRCDSDRSNLKGQILYLGEDPPCHYRVEIFTPYACTTCTTDSYMPSLGECMPDGTQSRFWIKKPEASACFGGESPPATATVACNLCSTGDYTWTWGDCDDRSLQAKNFKLKVNSTCVETPSTKPRPETQSCEALVHAIANSPVLVVVIVVVLGFLVLLIAVLIMWHRHKKQVKRRGMMKLKNEVDSPRSGASPTTTTVLGPVLEDADVVSSPNRSFQDTTATNASAASPPKS